MASGYYSAILSRWIPGKPKPPSNPPIKPPAHVPPPFGARVAAYCHSSLAYAGSMVYDESVRRSQLFSRKPGDFRGAHADCSQFCASILHWLGVKTVTNTDWTGTLVHKGKQIGTPKPGCVAIWGAGSGVHAAFVTEKNGQDWWCVGFGHQGAPDRSTLSGMNAYFNGAGHPGVRFYDYEGA